MSTPMILSQVSGDSARARLTDPTTSHQAADSISTEALEASEIEVLEVLAASRTPLSGEQIEAKHLERARLIFDGPDRLYSGSRLRTALKQLAKAGRVVPDGETRTKSGRRAVTWRIGGAR